MKNCSLVLFLFLALITGTVIGQVPQGIPYQVVARDTQGQPLASRAVKVRFSVLDSTATGTAVYVETHAVTTSALGLFAVNVGMGTPVTGTFSGINWGVNSKFLKVELDTTASGNNYVDLGTQQMMSVPYALYAGTSSTVAGSGVEGQILTYCNGVPVWTNGGLCPARITALNCSSAVNNGTLSSGIAAIGVSSVVSYSGGNGGAYVAQSISSTGVTGLTATLSAGTLANGNGSLTYTISGTPSAAGTASFAFAIGGQSCTFTRTVVSGLVSGISSATCGATNVHNPAKGYGSMTDQDGNVYKTILIGTQEWMAENLKVSHYRNGNLIPIVSDATVWRGLTTGATCWYKNDSSTYHCPFGKLYNWYSVTDSRKLCPFGWHIPSDSEWVVLTAFLVGDGGAMKTSGIQYWLSSNTNATNSSGFSGLPAGYRSFTVSFSLSGANACWWSSTLSPASSNTAAWSRFLNYFDGNVDQSDVPNYYGLSVRCLRD